MKYLYVIMAMVLLASCGAETKEVSNDTTSDIIVEQVLIAPDTSVLENEEIIDDVIEDVISNVMDDVIVEDMVDGGVIIDDETTEISDTIVADISNDIDSELVLIEDDKLTTDETKMVKLTASYNNTKVDVAMDINYSVDETGIIDSIDVTSSNWDLKEFNDAAQNDVVGKTIKEATEIDFAIGGSSLTTDAFKKALKDNM